MKNNLGKDFFVTVLFLLIAGPLLQAEDFSYTLHVDKPEPYVKEAVTLTLDINQTNPENVLLFNFTLLRSDAYTFQRVDIQETNTFHHAKIHYVYLLYPLESGDIDIGFELIKKVTTEDNVAYSVSGDRDNVKGLVSVDTAVKLPPLHLKVKELPHETLLVGNFSLTYSIKKHKAQAHEPLPIQVNITGEGFLPLLDTLLPKDGNFTRFTEQPVVQSVANTKGTQSTVTYSMALSHTHSFTLPPVNIKAFNPDTKKSYLLTMPQQVFEITTLKENELVDAIDSPALLTQDWSWIRTLFSYLVVFTAGFFSALSWKWSKKQRRKEEDPLKKKIQNCSDGKTLLQLLMSLENKRFNASIEQLEASLYGDGKIPLNKVKQNLLEKIR